MTLPHRHHREGEEGDGVGEGPPRGDAPSVAGARKGGLQLRWTVPYRVRGLSACPAPSARAQVCELVRQHGKATLAAELCQIG